MKLVARRGEIRGVWWSAKVQLQKKPKQSRKLEHGRFRSRAKRSMITRSSRWMFFRGGEVRFFVADVAPNA